MTKLLIIDNYDSFTYNLSHLFGSLAEVDVNVVRNDDDFMQGLEKGLYEGVIISPGPGNPLEEAYFGQNTEVIRRFGMNGLPVLGICLGFQGLSAAFGASLKEAAVPQHGKVSGLKIIQTSPILKDIPDGIKVMRYHSLMIDMDRPFPDELKIFAETEPDSLSVARNGREIMGICHRDLPLYGLQFHPESFATELGPVIAGNFVDIVRRRKS